MEIAYEMVSATNYSERVVHCFHRQSSSHVGWESTPLAITPIDILFKLKTLAFVTEIYLHPKLQKYSHQIEVLCSMDNNSYEPVACIDNFTDAVRVQISSLVRYLKITILQKEHSSQSSLELLKIYGHSQAEKQHRLEQSSLLKDKIDAMLIEFGSDPHDKDFVDEETLITLHDMSQLRVKFTQEGAHAELKQIDRDIKTVISLGQKIHKLSDELARLKARQSSPVVKDILDELLTLSRSRDKFDEKYETRRFEDMIAFDSKSSRNDEILRKLLEEDRLKLEMERNRSKQAAHQKKEQLDNDFDNVSEDDWWNKENALDAMGDPLVDEPVRDIKSPPKIPQEKQFKFQNQYVYNKGDADLEKYIAPLVGEFGGQYLGDLELLRRYEQMEYLDVLGARIWISAHSENWRQRAAAVQAVLNFSQDPLPERYESGQTKNLFLALMEFARVNAEDKVLQIYYTSLKIMTVALAPPICGEDVPPMLINKSINKFMSILVDKVSEMNARAKEISLKTIITIFKHPAADLSLAIHETLRVCKPEHNLKFVSVDKQNPRIILSRLEIVGKILQEFKSVKKNDCKEILEFLAQGALNHSHNEVRVAGVQVIELVNKHYKEATVEWYKQVIGLRPTLCTQIEEKLHIR